jgi:UDP-3-O-[3-hydroxymyristoyl] N-acetylglucosamine deacetylase
MRSVEGPGLHTGARGTVRFDPCAGPVVLRIGDAETRISELRVVDTTRSTTVACAGDVRIGTVEHVLAALGGLGIYEGVAVVLSGREVPLADGGARVYADAVAALVVPQSSRGRCSLRVAREGVVDVGASRYELSPGPLGEGDARGIEVTVDFGGAQIAKSARWDGDAEDFRARIAVARTFGFEHEVQDLLERGLASHVTRESVVVIGEDRVLSAGAPFTADEPARHKLLDLIGDLYIYGGPPRGFVRALRPGHAATHEAMRRALESGLVVRDELGK